MFAKSRVTMDDVARVAGVSIKSISRVINGEEGVSPKTRLRILKAVADLGYIVNPAAQLLRGVPNTLGVIVYGVEGYSGQILSGMSQAAHQLNYNLILYVQETNERTFNAYRAFVGSGLIAGLLMIVPYDSDQLITLCNSYQIPYTMVDSQGTAFAASGQVIVTTNAKGICDATEFLGALGHQKIGFISGNLKMSSARERVEGYQLALQRLGRPYDTSLVIRGDWSPESGYEGARQLIATHPDLTAIVASDDLTAFGAMDAIKELGLRVGQEISVTGFDDIPLAAKVRPALTTVRQPMVKMGEAAVALLVSALEKKPHLTSIQKEFPTELIVRESTGRALQTNCLSSSTV